MSDSGVMINTLMKNKRVSMKKLSEMSGLSAGQLSRMEAGSNFNSGTAAAVKVAKALGVSVDDILGDNQIRSLQLKSLSRIIKNPAERRLQFRWSKKQNLKSLLLS